MRIHHVALRTRDLARLERFYVETLGFVVTRRQEHSVWLAAGDAILMLERADEGEPAVPAGSKELVAFAIVRDEYAKYTHLVAVEARTASTIYFRDPDVLEA